MKDYNKIYKRLIKDIKKMRDQEVKFISIFKYPDHENYRIIDIIKSEHTVSMLNFLLKVCEEIEGRKCNMVNMNQEEFKDWKKEIQK